MCVVNNNNNNNNNYSGSWDIPLFPERGHSNGKLLHPQFLGGVGSGHLHCYSLLPAFPPYFVRTTHIHGMWAADDTTPVHSKCWDTTMAQITYTILHTRYFDEYPEENNEEHHQSCKYTCEHSQTYPCIDATARGYELGTRQGYKYSRDRDIQPWHFTTHLVLNTSKAMRG